MIDYAKLNVPPAVGARLLHHHLLSFRRPVDEQTGEVNDRAERCAEYHGLTFTHYASGRTTIHGSLHKYAQGGTNSGDFTFTQFRATVTELCGTFDLDPETLRLLQLEAGANLRPTIRTARVLRAIVCHRDGLAFSKMRSRDGRSLGLDLYRDQFGIKIYDKGYQYGLPFDLLRFEVKFTKGAPMHRMGIHTLNDLLNPNAWQRLQDRVMGIYDELVIAEPSIDVHSLTTSQRTFVMIATAPRYWQELTKGQRYKDRSRYADIVRRFAGSDLKGDLGRILKDKLNHLLNGAEQAIEMGDPFTSAGTIEKGDPFTDAARSELEDEKGPFHGSVNVGTGHLGPAVEVVRPATPEPLQRTTEEQWNGAASKEVRRCRTCGRDITDQRRGSRYCSEARHGKAAKRCRNAGSNPRHSRLRTLERIERDPLLFDHRPYIGPLTTGNYGTPTRQEIDPWHKEGKQAVGNLEHRIRQHLPLANR